MPKKVFQLFIVVAIILTTSAIMVQTSFVDQPNRKIASIDQLKQEVLSCRRQYADLRISKKIPLFKRLAILSTETILQTQKYIDKAPAPEELMALNDLIEQVGQNNEWGQHFENAEKGITQETDSHQIMEMLTAAATLEDSLNAIISSLTTSLHYRDSSQKESTYYTKKLISSYIKNKCRITELRYQLTMMLKNY